MPTSPASGPTCLPRSAQPASGPPAALLPARASRGHYGDRACSGFSRAVSQDERRSLVEALRRGQRRHSAPASTSSRRASSARPRSAQLAEHAAIGPGVSVLDLCCGVAGPGRFLTRELGCDYLGVDSSESAVADRPRARRRPALPLRGRGDSAAAAGQVRRGAPARDDARVPRQGGAAARRSPARSPPADGSRSLSRRALPLTESERVQMPAADTVWLIPLDEMHSLLARAGLAVRWEEDWSESHRDVAASLADAYAADSTAIAAQTGRRRWTSSSPRTGCGASGSRPAASASSLSSPSEGSARAATSGRGLRP